MNPLDLLKDLNALLNTNASAEVLRERVALLAVQLEHAAKNQMQLQETLRELQAVHAREHAELEARRAAEHFVEARGVLWKRKPGGGYFDVPYCPACRLPLASEFGPIPFHCRQSCGFNSSITRAVLPAIIAGLPG